MKHTVELLHHKDNPDAEVAWEIIREVVYDVASTCEVIRVENQESVCCEDDMRLLVDGEPVKDVATGPPVPGNFVCGDIGELPPCWALEAAILHAMKPRGILFMCVANSARSQIAEGIARSLAPAGVKVFSAGSRPAKLRKEVIQVMSEIGIDVSKQYSKSASEIPADQVDAVITVCAEEVCPVWLHPVTRIHWGMPDPAAVTGPKRIRAFRDTRDELLLRIRRMF